MKNLIYFLLFSSAVFSQNYNYGIDDAKKSAVAPKMSSVGNQKEEKDYLDAYLLPITKKATLQLALNTHTAVRLEKGDYSGSPIVMHSGQKLYGHPSISGVPHITIASGSTNVILEDLTALRDSDLLISFQPGAVISNCIFKTIKGARISAINSMIENNQFIDINGTINFNCSNSGYFRNNRIIKHQAQSTSNMLVMKGNSTTPSYGNVNIHSNYITSNGVTTDLNNLQSSTFIGLDCESYSGLTKELFYAQNIGKMNLSTVQGGMLYDSGLGYFNIDADNLLSIYNAGNSLKPSVIGARTNYLNTFTYQNPTRSSGSVSGFTAYSNITTRNFVYNGQTQTSAVSNPAALSSFLLGKQYEPWARPTWNELPNPLGVNWANDRIGKPDSTAYIQNLINTDRIAELPAGIFYIKSSLIIPLDKTHGIVGQGTGSTVICGLTDDFPLIKVVNSNFGNFALAHLTLQGGSAGVYAEMKTMLWAYQNIKFVVFRNQQAGIQTHQIFGFDNNFIDNVAFVNCKKGFFQDPLRPYIQGNVDGSSYTDKTMFYKNQFIDCETGLSMQATRGNNMNAWVDCYFNGGGQAMNGGGDSTIIANCDFTNYKGKNVITSNGFTMFNCDFYKNYTTGATFRSVDNNFEGCNFLDDNDMFAPNIDNVVGIALFNSTVTGSLNVSSFRSINALICNSKTSNPAFKGLLVNVKAGVPTVIIGTLPKPYPQLLVRQ